MMTPRQRDALAFIGRYQAEHGGVSPTCKEIGKGLDLSSTSGVHRLLTELEERGLIRRLPSRSRAIEILKREEHEALLLELCDQVACYVAERPNFLSTETRNSLIAAARAAVATGKSCAA